MLPLDTLKYSQGDLTCSFEEPDEYKINDYFECYDSLIFIRLNKNESFISLSNSLERKDL